MRSPSHQFWGIGKAIAEQFQYGKESGKSFAGCLPFAHRLTARALTGIWFRRPPTAVLATQQTATAALTRRLCACCG
ncbi:hypothetical protein [Coleofasciculus sp. FACHB-501]|uniref:hypothetical protein n=1 Tax=Cyanophyceae TaxID=3028117 RepID=UPI0016843DA6|nr:hypothetical protein [Coleofasciculus sp. FACHB-501]MBD1836668.1 hypothetical protein [Coleofasciculus sp. FACHB-501]